MVNPLDTDVGSELFSSYEAELKLVQADLQQRLDQISELSGEPRKSPIRQAERSLEEASDLVRPRSTLNFLFNIIKHSFQIYALKLNADLLPIGRPNAHRETKHPLRKP